MSELTKLINISEKLSQQLNDVDITTVTQLKEIGSKAAWLRILANDSSACYMRLCALEGAIRGVRWHYLSDDVKKSLKQFYSETKSTR